MHVYLINHTYEPTATVATAAKLCYSDANICDLVDGISTTDVDSYIHTLSSYGHYSPFEHITFTFGIEGISRACSHQLVRHRIASYSQKSQRYVGEGDFEFITPPEIASDENANAEFSKQMQAISESYKKLANILITKHKAQYIAEGKSEKSALTLAKKQAYEDARFVLPNACETKIIVTMNARSLLNFFKLRCCNRAQWEIRELAQHMFELCYQQAPAIFETAGPSCCSGPCPEGIMGCGNAATVRAQYTAIKNTYK